jgi:hypothetical protein
MVTKRARNAQKKGVFGPWSGAKVGTKGAFQQGLSLHLHYEISREGEEFRRIPKTPVVKEIRVTPPDPDPWWQRILERIVGVFGA